MMEYEDVYTNVDSNGWDLYCLLECVDSATVLLCVQRLLCVDNIPDLVSECTMLFSPMHSHIMLRMYGPVLKLLPQFSNMHLNLFLLPSPKASQDAHGESLQSVRKVRKVKQTNLFLRPESATATTASQ